MIGIIGAMSCEVSLLKDKLKDYKTKEIAGITFYEGKLNNKDVVIAQSGIGKVNSSICTSILILEFKVTVIINSGIAGGIKNAYHKDVIVVQNFTYLDVNATFFGYKIGQVPSMPQYFLPDINMFNVVRDILTNEKIEYKLATALTADSFITTKNNLEYEDNDNVFICEMEGASIAQTCYRFNVPFIALRFISDVVGEDSQVKNYQLFEEEMALKSSLITLNVIDKL